MFSSLDMMICDIFAPTAATAGASKILSSYISSTYTSKAKYRQVCMDVCLLVVGWQPKRDLRFTRFQTKSGVLVGIEFEPRNLEYVANVFKVGTRKLKHFCTE